MTVLRVFHLGFALNSNGLNLNTSMFLIDRYSMPTKDDIKVICMLALAVLELKMLHKL